MLTIHLLGHAHVSRNHQPVPVSAKAVALISYLSIEKLPQHRERLADLLWTTAEARKNLRVELARIRTAGLNLFPASRQLLYLENVTNDFELWQSRLGQDLNQAQLSEWLAMLRGFPLSGLEDLGSSTFQEWVDQQRWVLSQQIEDGLSQMYWQYARANQTWAMRLIAARADTLGYELGDAPAAVASPVPPTPDPAPPLTLPTAPVSRTRGLHFERAPEEETLRRLLQTPGAPQVVVMHGPPGMGKSYLADRLANQAAHSAGLTLRIPAMRSGRLVLASLAQGLLGHGDPECNDALRRMLLAPTSLEEDLIKVAVALGKLSRSVLLVFDHAHAAPADLAPLLNYLLEVPAEGPRLFVLLSRQRPAQAPLTRALRGRAAGVYSELEVPPLTQASVQQVLESRFPSAVSSGRHSDAARLLQRSEGNPLHLLSLLEQGDPGVAGGTHFPQPVRDIHDADIDQWPPTLMTAMERLSAIYGPFDQQVAQAALGAGLAGSADSLLYAALERQILREVDPAGALHLPEFRFVADPERPETLYAFASEGLRIALASRSPQLVRQDVRRRLVPVLAGDAPGLAAHYARRAGLTEEAERLQRVYRTELQRRQLPGGDDQAAPAVARPAAAEPPRVQVPARPPLACQGYLVAQDDRGWLEISSSGQYGHPQTLRLLLPLPASPNPAGSAPQENQEAELRVTWRLDVLSGGEELGPARLPFPLRLRLGGAPASHVLTRVSTPDYMEDGVQHTVHADVSEGRWLEHRLTFPDHPGDAPTAGGQTLELSVRALDVALTLGALSWQGQDLLPLVTAAAERQRGPQPPQAPSEAVRADPPRPGPPVRTLS